jgi:LmbE family N-acetylglucosaminyl deacetylase
MTAARSRQTLLGVWAHPDDEAYLSAGLMAAARRRGDRVVVVSATAGERGTGEPDRWPPRRLAARRRHELRASLAALGVHEHQFLGFPDGGCHRVPRARGVERVAAVIRAVRPDTIVTFGPEGMTGHLDHQVVSAWTTEAWRAAGSDARLWYATLTPDFHERWGAVNDRVGLWSKDVPPPSVDTADLACVLSLDGEVLDQKLAALRAHASQTTPLVALLGEETYRAWWRNEFFVDATSHMRLTATSTSRDLAGATP